MDSEEYIRENFQNIIICTIAVIIFVLLFPWFQSMNRYFYLDVVNAFFWFFNIIILGKSICEENKNLILLSAILAIGAPIIYAIFYYALPYPGYSYPRMVRYGYLFTYVLEYTPPQYVTFSLSTFLGFIGSRLLVSTVPTFIIYVLRVRFRDQINASRFEFLHTKKIVINNSYTKFCTNCGAQIDNDSMFCPICGNKDDG